MATIFKIVVIAVLINLSSGYKKGPPVGGAGYGTLCSDMLPSGHEVGAQTTTPPYEIVTSQNCYKEGLTVQVRVTVKSSDTYFRGFFLMARQGSDSSQAYGAFATAGESGIQELNCFSASKSAIGHNRNDVTKSKTFNWMAPSGVNGTLHFRATVVRRKRDYWVGVMSSDIMYNSSCVSMTLSSDPNGASMMSISHIQWTIFCIGSVLFRSIMFDILL